MDHAATTSSPTPTNLLQFLSLSLSPASKVIVKQGKTKRLRMDGAFQCRTCGRRFATFQALGGHRTSHKRPRVRADGLDLLLGARPDKGAVAAAKHVHRCHTCGIVFATGQALGGHMRRHRAAAFDASVALKSMSTMTSSGLSEDGDHHDAQDLILPRTLFHFI